MLLELAWDGDLAADIRVMQDEGRSLRDIAARVSDGTGHRISYESLRRWYGVTDRETSAA